MTVLAFDPNQRTNAERVVDLAALGYLPEPVLDPTYGRKGGMWKLWRPKVLIASDLDPEAGVPTFDFRNLPWPDGTFGSVLFDPPYRLAGTATNQGGMDGRYGIDRYRSIAQTHNLMCDGLEECARVVRPRGFVIAKCMDQVCSGRLWLQTGLLSERAEECGLVLKDFAHLPSHRKQPERTTKCRYCKGRGSYPDPEVDNNGFPARCPACDGAGRLRSVQQHIARNYSTFLVFQRRS